MSDINVSKELVQKAAGGDRAAFEELYRETCRAVYFTCFGFLKDEQEAQDITQDVYLAAFEQLGTLEDADKFKPWLYRMAANKSINCLKKKKPSLPGDEQLEDMETEENENFLPEEYALNAAKREMVLDITRKVCTDAQYQTILLYYFNELSVAEIAEVMECQENNVKKRMSIARAKIRDGVLQYEKKSGDKLYSFAAIPFLTALFTAQMQDMQMPSFPHGFLSALPRPTLAAQTAKTGGRMVLKGIQAKIAAGIAAAVVVVGGVTAVAVITNRNAEETSVGAQEESILDAAGVENTGGPETLQETENSEEPGEETLSAESETAEESETTGEVVSEEIEAVGGSAKSEETETAETTPEPTADPEYTYTDMEAAMYVKQSVNVRDLPSTDGNRLGGLSTNQEIAVTGQCNETGWYRFEYNGQTAYVSNSYISDAKTEVAAAGSASNSGSASAQTASSDGGSSNNTGKEPCPYPLNRILTETTEYGLTIWVLYTTMPGETIFVPQRSGIPIDNYGVFDDNGDYGTVSVREVMNIEESAGVFYGFHFVTPPSVKVGTYAEGTVYRYTTGVHTYNTYNPELGRVRCPNNEIGCQPGTIN